MRILLLSDSHGDLTTLNQIISIEKADAILHLGDSELDKNKLDSLGIIGVLGNNDQNGLKITEILEYEKVRIMLTHGHKYGVNYNLTNLGYKALEYNAKIICYGHTHVAKIEENDGLIFVNPGALSYPRTQFGKTYGMLEINSGKINIIIKNLEGQKVMEYGNSI